MRRHQLAEQSAEVADLQKRLEVLEALIRKPVG
jgi:hypothetical protein